MRLKVNFNNPRWITDYCKNFRLRQRTKFFKTCSKCGEVRSIGDFVKDRRYKDGLTMFAGLAGMSITGSDIRSGKKKF